MQHNRKLFSVGVVALGAILALSACGSKTKATPSNTSSTSTTTSSSTGSGTGTSTTLAPIKVGVMCSCTGAFGSVIVPSWDVLQSWEKSVNAAGGLDGHQVDFVMKDDASVPGTSATDAAALISDHVAVIMDVDILDEVWEKAADAANIPVIGGNISSPPFDTDPNFYAAGQTNNSVIYSVFATAKLAGATKVAIFYCAESPSCAQSIPSEKTTGAAIGIPVVYSSSIAFTAPNYTAQCLAAKQAGADGLFLADGIAVVARVAQDCNKQGYNPIYLTEGTGYAGLITMTPGLKANTWLSFPDLPYFSTNAAVQTMITTVNKYFPGLTSNPTLWSEFAAEGWTGAELLAAAGTNASFSTTGTITASDVVSGLNKVSGETLGGFSPSLTFTAGQPHPTNCWYTAHVSNGVPAQVGGQTCQSGS